MDEQSIHFDPEFETFTYGDPTRPKSSLKRLDEGSLLVFYAGLKGWDFHCEPALYIVGYFLVAKAGLADSFSRAELTRTVRQQLSRQAPGRLRGPKGSSGSRQGRCRKQAAAEGRRISSVGQDRSGGLLHRLSPEMQQVFGDFGGSHEYPAQPPAMGGSRIRGAR